MAGPRSARPGLRRRGCAVGEGPGRPSRRGTPSSGWCGARPLGSPALRSVQRPALRFGSAAAAAPAAPAASASAPAIAGRGGGRTAADGDGGQQLDGVVVAVRARRGRRGLGHRAAQLEGGPTGPAAVLVTGHGDRLTVRSRRWRRTVLRSSLPPPRRQDSVFPPLPPGPGPTVSGMSAGWCSGGGCCAWMASRRARARSAACSSYASRPGWRARQYGLSCGR